MNGANLTHAHPYQDASLPVTDRVADLLGLLNLEQKAGQLTQYFYMGVAMNIPADFDITSVPEEHRAFLQQPLMVRAAIRQGTAGAVLFVKDPALINELQQIAVEEGPHGIPLLVGYDVVHGLRTIFPVPIAQAATWNPAAVEAAQAIAASEARAVGINWTFAPMIDIARDPRWGRIVEGPGEDPVLGAAIAAAQVRGFQGDLGARNVISGPKHFAGYGASRGGRDYDDAEVSDSELHNVYLPPFRAAIEAGAANVMSAYMDLNGVPASGNRWLLTDLLRGELGFDGFTVSDANAVRSMEIQHFAADLTDAAARAVDAGLDMEMAMFDPAYARIPQAIADGRLTEAAVDEAVRRVLTAKFRLGLFESPYVDPDGAPGVGGREDDSETARWVAEQSIVLLKNSGAALPLRADELGSVAVIGQLAASKRDTLGPWVFDHVTADTVSILEALRVRLGDAVQIEHAPGAGIPNRLHPSPFDRMDPTVETTSDDHEDDDEIERAVALAASADVAIVVVGERQNHIGEKASRSTLELPGRQLEQLQRIVGTGTSVVLIAMTGRPLDLRWPDANVPAIMQAWYPGSRGGDAVVAALLGDVSPAGRLPFSWPRHVGQVPMVYAHNRTFQPDEQDKRYANEPSTPLYPFGYGLSYASFSYENLSAHPPVATVGETITVSADVTNTGTMAADEVAQLYIHQRHGTSTRPVRELKGFERIALRPGETRRVTFILSPRELRHWSAVPRDWVLDATTLDIWVGGDSLAALSTSVRITR
ncbi:beta-glucosidase [Microbacterium terrae]|uniref:Exo-alpha-(1->6)-L-arabinopyranosidase n=1 Tax=Microbacterium terrae TaxID=69369 RepID=A0A0M2H1U7_9MICO|nr:glycoside hydrolase family 3 N-terminal domain-containing protein [Microbacterium terrae]KJL37538.1 Periplasmic beta-glucosidase precursor [Microbacterium terrae]MBP1076368.1 beta-glucosidase [Microbacterium terrae]GLJ97192.1 beta-glucosidase [Microbacterium terrae]